MLTSPPPSPDPWRRGEYCAAGPPASSPAAQPSHKQLIKGRVTRREEEEEGRRKGRIEGSSRAREKFTTFKGKGKGMTSVRFDENCNNIVLASFTMMSRSCRGMRTPGTEVDQLDLEGDPGEDLEMLLVYIQDAHAGSLAELLEQMRKHRVLIRLALNFAGSVEEVQILLDSLP
eukprot:767698-Hanusia_phi.AAC.2